MKKKVVHKTFGRRLLKAYTRLRIPLLTFFIVLLLFFSTPTLRLWLIGLPFLVAGFFLRILSCGTLKKDRELAKYGIYALLRHPLYVANTCIGIGFCFMSGKGLFFLLFLAFTLLMYAPTIWLEEKVLEEIFGDAYLEYARTTPRFLPRRWGKNLWKSFSWERVRDNYEPQGVLAQSLVALLLLLKAIL